MSVQPRIPRSLPRWLDAVALDRAGLAAFEVRGRERIGTISDEFLRLLGYGPEQRPAIEAGWRPLVHPQDAPTLTRLSDQQAQGSRQAVDMELRLMHQQGHYLWVHWISRRMEDTGSADGGRVVGIIQDISARKAATAALLSQTEALESAQALAGVGSWRWSVGSPVTTWSPQMFRTFGRVPGNQPVSWLDGHQRYHPSSWSALQEAMKAALQSGTPWELELQIVRADGSAGWVISKGHAQRDAQGRVSHLEGTLQDITARRQDEAALSAARAEVREVWARLEAVRIEERKRLARDVHDELGQMLTALQLEVETLSQTAADPSALGRLRHLLGDTMGMARDIMSRLRPAALDLGLVASLQWLARDCTLRTDVDCRVLAEADPKLEDAIHHALFRIAQEALTNVIRHAHTQEAFIRLRPQGAGWELSIQDKGCGFHPGLATEGVRFGLLGMRERALQVGAQLFVESLPGQGTTVRVQVEPAARDHPS